MQLSNSKAYIKPLELLLINICIHTVSKFNWPLYFIYLFYTIFLCLHQTYVTCCHHDNFQIFKSIHVRGPESTYVQTIIYSLTHSFMHEFFCVFFLFVFYQFAIAHRPISWHPWGVGRWIQLRRKEALAPPTSSPEQAGVEWSDEKGISETRVSPFKPARLSCCELSSDIVAMKESDARSATWAVTDTHLKEETAIDRSSSSSAARRC